MITKYLHSKGLEKKLENIKNKSKIKQIQELKIRFDSKDWNDGILFVNTNIINKFIENNKKKQSDLALNGLLDNCLISNNEVLFNNQHFIVFF